MLGEKERLMLELQEVRDELARTERDSREAQRALNEPGARATGLPDYCRELGRRGDELRAKKAEILRRLEGRSESWKERLMLELQEVRDELARTERDSREAQRALDEPGAGATGLPDYCRKLGRRGDELRAKKAEILRRLERPLTAEERERAGRNAEAEEARRRQEEAKAREKAEAQEAKARERAEAQEAKARERASWERARQQAEMEERKREAEERKREAEADTERWMALAESGASVPLADSGASSVFDSGTSGVFPLFLLLVLPGTGVAAGLWLGFGFFGCLLFTFAWTVTLGPVVATVADWFGVMD